jgi:hypothetical protein
MITDVAHVGGAEEGVADGMDEYVCVGVTQQPEAVVNADSPEPQLAVGN